jgi:cytochrome P450
MVPTDGGCMRRAAMMAVDKTTESRMTPTERARAFDLRKLDAAFYADPYPLYDALRATEPVKRMPDGSLFLTRYRDVQTVYRDPKTFSSDKTVEFGPKYGAHTALFAHHTTSLVFNDPPRHTRVRKLIAGALTARAIAAMEPGLVQLIDGLLDQAATRGEIDLMTNRNPRPMGVVIA